MIKTDGLFRCGSCEKYTQLIVRARYIQDHNNEYEDHFLTTWRILECPECSALMLGQTYIVSYSEESKFEVGAEDDKCPERIIYPVPKDRNDDELLPEPVKKAYQSAINVRNEPNAFAVQVARTLEIVCKYEKAAGKGLAQNLENLAKAGRIPPALASIANEFKVLRNIGAHADRTNDDVETWEVPIIEEFADAILEYLYIAPSKFTTLQESLKRTHPF